MRLILICVMFSTLTIVNCSEEFVTVWTPNKYHDERSFKTFVLPSNIENRTEITFQYQDYVYTMPSYTSSVHKVEIQDGYKIGTNEDFDAIMTLFRNESTSSGTRQMCMTKTLHNIKNEKNRQIYGFVQIDKPIYKPGDTVNFRIVVIDRNFKPCYMKHTKVIITDSLNRPIKEYTDLDNVFGVFSANFNLSPNTAFGVWKIQVVFDGPEEKKAFREFEVNKVILPPFTVELIANPHILMPNSILQLSFHAKNQAENFIRGNAKLTIKCTTTDQTIISKTFEDVLGSRNLMYHVSKDLNHVASENLEYEATIAFTETETQMEVNKSLKFKVIALGFGRKLSVVHSEGFIPGLPFHVKVFVYDFKDSLIESSLVPVTLMYNVTLQDGRNKTLISDHKIKNGVVKHSFVVPTDVQELSINIRLFYYNNCFSCDYDKRIKNNAHLIKDKKLIVDAAPKNPDIGANVTVHIVADFEINFNQIVIFIIGRDGYTYYKQEYCDHKVSCSFYFRYNHYMTPKAKIFVYYVKDRSQIYKAETTIMTENFEEYEMDIDMLSSSEPRSQVDIRVTTKPNSNVYLLGVDKRYLFEGNDIRNDVVKELSDYDSHYNMTIFDIKEENWNDCTSQELDRIIKGRRLVALHSANSHHSNEIKVDSKKPETAVKASNNEIRENFQDVWFVDEFLVPDRYVTKSYLVPESNADWIISSFSINSKFGLAFGQQKKLTVKNQSFMKVLMPTSIKFGESIQVGVIIYNYNRKMEALNVSVTMTRKENDLQFYEDECTLTPINERKFVKSVTVPYKDFKKVSFYIQVDSNRTLTEKIVKVSIAATAKSKYYDEFNDRIIRKIRVEPVGVKTYNIHHLNTESIILNANRTSQSFEYNFTDNDEYTKSMIKFSGGVLTSDMNQFLKFYPTSSLDQLTSMLKANVEFGRYFKAFNPKQSIEGFNIIYQSILDIRTKNWTYRNSAGYIAFFVDTIASAMELGALPVSSEMIEKELDILKDYQTIDGHFENFGSFPDSNNDFFRTAFVLIPFLRHKKLVTKNYDDVISKGFDHLSGIDIESGMESYSIAALAYSLNNQYDQAQKLLVEVEKVEERFDTNKKCYKLSVNDTNCNLRHTSYAAIAFLTMKKLNETAALLKFINGEYRILKNYGYTFDYAIATEALSRYLITRRHSSPLDLTLKLSNELDFNNTVHITRKNNRDDLEVEFPSYTLNPKITVNGTGVCFLTTITENIITAAKTSSKFTLTVTPSLSDRTVTVCATYHPVEGDVNLQPLFNVIYDIEIPTGYLFDEVVNMTSIPEIKLVEPQLNETRVHIYFNDFEPGKNYCVDLKTRKIYNVKNLKNAGVKVYDFNDKNDAAVDFYTFTSEC